MPDGRRARRLRAAAVVARAAAVPLLMRLPLPRVAALLERVPVARRADPERVPRASDAVEWLLRRAPLLARTPCQVRAVALYYEARRAGEAVELVFGAGWADGRFVAHCWLDRDGAPYLERRDPRLTFAELFRIPRATSPATSPATAR